MTDPPRIRLRTVALPAEHGGWGFLFEPIALGLVVAPSIAGACIAVMSVGIFLARHPLKLVWLDRKRRANRARTRLAALVGLSYGLVAALGLAGAVRFGGVRVLVPYLVVSPLVVAYVVLDYRKHTRTLFAELVGPLVLGVAASSVTLGAGWTAPAAFVLWVVLMVRAVPSILYVRARLRLERGRPADIRLATVSCVIGLGVTGALAWRGVTPLLVVVGATELLARALHGLSSRRRHVTAKGIGISELVHGLLYVALVAIGYHVEL